MTDAERDEFRQFNGNMLNSLWRMSDKLFAPAEVWPKPQTAKPLTEDELDRRDELAEEHFTDMAAYEEERGEL